jgi:hypothetical protein
VPMSMEVKLVFLLDSPSDFCFIVRLFVGILVGRLIGVMVGESVELNQMTDCNQRWEQLYND